jgi:hypothetical protein
MPQLGGTRVRDTCSPNWVDPETLNAAMEQLNTTNFVIEVEIEIPSIAGATPAAALYAGAVRATFGNLPLGIVAHRNIAGTSTLSQHNWGNAVDVMCTGDLHRQVAYWSDANRALFSIAHLLADPYFPSPLGDHYSHVHADFFPQYPL